VVSIQLTQGKAAIVDDEDADLASFNWCAKKKTKTFYAQRNIRNSDGSRTLRKLHQVIAERMGIVGNPDHLDRDGLNNRRSNLRPATASQNGANQGKRSDNTSGVKGVYWHAGAGKWRARIKVDGKYHSLGYFIDLKDAKAVVETAREKAFGEFACHG
jgi:hypothetical protein